MEKYKYETFEVLDFQEFIERENPDENLDLLQVNRVLEVHALCSSYTIGSVIDET